MELKPGYKQAELGIIPEEWNVYNLNQITDPKRSICYGIVQTGRPVNGGIKCVRVLDIVNGRIDPKNLITTSVEISAAYKRTLLYTGDLVIALRGKIGELAVVDKKLSGANLTRGVAILPASPEFDSSYLCQYLCSPLGKKTFEKNLNGSALQEIPIAALRLVPALVPPLLEQRAIAAALSDTDALLSSLDRLLAKKRDIKQAVMQQLLTGKQRLPGYSGEWGSLTIEQLEQIGIVKLSRGQVISKKDIEASPGGFPIYSSSVKNNGLFGRYGKFMFDEELITWSVDGGGHFFYRDKHKFSVTNVCGFMRLDPTKLSYRFLAAQLQLLHSSMIFDYQDKAHPSVIRKAYTVLVPELTEQTAIAAVLSEMDAEIDMLQQRRDKTRAIKQGMMQELLTGRTRLV